ncbi:class I SAM-dependent methyltransferase [Rhodococcus oryzae]|uniref:Class I SAM-dependent methyltransferase n=1 Tax=Rhodococcus oryzae TaxID=2571143 RepID=A0ABY2RIM6_9NOCA|nr:class I SAM-dependent methyltransferase [Rhodococcus oryzae]TJZ77069.1 class I SAM-dependent methyltransferase [Rhodococcus oryzae]
MSFAGADGPSEHSLNNVTRWENERDEEQSRAYIRRFEELAAQGVDLHGEARMLDAVIAPGSRVLDAGCGTGRVGVELSRRGHHVTAVDLDPVLVEAARAHPELTVHQADLAELDLPGETFDAIIAAGNVLIFLEPGTERTVLQRFAAHLADGGVLVTGFATDYRYTVRDFDADLEAAGLVFEQRFATWDLRPWRPDATWAVTVARKRG